MGVLLFFVVLAVFVGTWWWLAKEFRKSGRGFIVRHLLGCVGAWMTSLLIAGIAVSMGIVESLVPQRAQQSQSSANAVPATPSLIVEPKQPERPDYSYTVVKDEYRPGLPRTVEVLLSRRLTDTELSSLAEKLKADFKKNPIRTFFGFRVRGQNDPAYWANASFDPGYSGTIIGLSLEDYERLFVLDISGYREIKGSWLKDGTLGNLMVLYRKDDKFFLDLLFADGSKRSDEYSSKPMANGALRLEQPEADSGEYYLVAADGSLQGWNENGNYMNLSPRIPIEATEPSYKD